MPNSTFMTFMMFTFGLIPVSGFRGDSLQPSALGHSAALEARHSGLTSSDPNPGAKANYSFFEAFFCTDRSPCSLRAEAQDFHRKTYDRRLLRAPGIRQNHETTATMRNKAAD